MSYAVVKFVDEVTDSNEEVVSEIPVSWLVRDSKYCKWPSEKYVNVYIAKGLPPQSDWEEYRVEVECICDSLAEAKKKAKGDNEGKVGRGYRKIKPLDYFSPAEEEQKLKDKKKEISLKRNNIEVTEDYHLQYLEDITGVMAEKSVEVEKFIDKQPSPVSSVTVIENSESNSSAALLEGAKVIYTEPLENEHDREGASCSTGSLLALADSTELVTALNSKLDTVLKLLAQLKIDTDDIRQRIEEMSAKPLNESEHDLPMELPVQSLGHLEELNEFFKANSEQKRTFIHFLKRIGGNNYKDFTTRILKNILSNMVAEACS